MKASFAFALPILWEETHSKSKDVPESQSQLGDFQTKSMQSCVNDSQFQKRISRVAATAQKRPVRVCNPRGLGSGSDFILLSSKGSRA